MKRIGLRLATSIIFGIFLIGTWLLYNEIYLPQKRAATIEKFAQLIVQQMSAEDKAGQVIHINIPSNSADTIALKEVAAIRPGGAILFARNLGDEQTVKKLIVALQVGVLPLLISADQESGFVKRMGPPVPEFPSATSLGQTENPELCYAVGFATSEALYRVGINVFFAPILDVNSDPENPVIAHRSFGSTVATVTGCAVPFEQGARLGGSLPVIKHFPGHGDTKIDSHLGLPLINKTLEELKQFELIPFQASIDSGARAVMTAHIIYPRIDSELPATLSAKILTDLLRRDMKFSGLIFTDAMEMHAISKNFGHRNPAVLALKAGADVILLTSWGDLSRGFKEKILTEYINGGFDQKLENGDIINILDQRVLNQIRLKLEHLDAKASDYLINFTNTDLRKTDVDAVLDFMRIQREKIRQEKSDQVKKKFPTLNAAASSAAIRSFPNDFTRLDKKQQIEFRLKRNHFPPETKSASTADYLITESFSQNTVTAMGELARTNSKRQIIVLHYGKPYMLYPREKNLVFLISSSPTVESLKALTRAVFKVSNESGVIQKISIRLK